MGRAMAQFREPHRRCLARASGHGADQWRMRSLPARRPAKTHMSNPVYISKYALTKGILKMTPREVPDSRTVTCRRAKALMDEYFHGEGTEWHWTLGEARERVEDMRVMEIERLRKKIKKLEALRPGLMDFIEV